MMKRNFFDNLENSDHPLLGPTLWGLQKWGMWQPKSGMKKTLNNFMHLTATIFVVTQYIELWIIRSNLELALRNLSISMLSTICVIKAGTFVFWQRDWKELVLYVSELEKRQISKNDPVTTTLIRQYTRYSRKVTYFYWILVTTTVLAVILAPLASFLSSEHTRVLIRNGTVPYPEIMSSWLPFNRRKGYGYWASVIEHSIICFYGGGIVAHYDSNAVVLMTFFAGQLKLLSVDCARIFGSENEIVANKEAMERIKDCHWHHVNLVKNSRIFNQVLSPVLFLYVIICSLMICASAIQLTTDGTTTMQKVWIAEYLMALIAQLFLYCWHSNNVLFMSDRIGNGVYESFWYTRNIPLRRSVLLLTGQLRKHIVFTAGPFTALNIATFVAIMKGSYSYFTLLSNKGN